MAHPLSRPRTQEEHRSLRVTTVLAFLPAVGLLLPYGIIGARPLPTVGIAAMFFSAAYSILVLGGRFRSPGLKVCIDFLLAVSIISVLVPSWIFLSQTHYSWHGGRLIVLGTYGTMPMIISCVLHFYLALSTLHSKVSISWEPHGCPNCDHDILRVSRQSDRVTSAVCQSDSNKDIPQSPPRFYDDDARESSEFQTSGFNTPRQSAETLASSTRTSGDLL